MISGNLTINSNFNIKEITKMQFNYGYEKKKFDAAWKQLAKTYEEAGMSADAIQAMYEYDWDVFKAARVEALHTQELDMEENEDEDWESPLFKNYREAISCEYDIFGSHSRYWWLEEITNPCLTIGIGSLSEEDKELLTLYIVEQKTDREIAKLLGVHYATVCRRLQKIFSLFKQSA